MAKSPQRLSFSEEKVIEAIHQGRGIAAAAARYLGCDVGVINRWRQASPKVAQAYKAAESFVTDLMEEALFQEALEKRNLQAIMFYLKAKAKDRGYGETVEKPGYAVIDVFLEEISGRVAAQNPKQLEHLED